MNLTIWDVYLVGQMDDLCRAFGGLVFLFGLGGVILFVLSFNPAEDMKKESCDRFRKLSKILLSMAFLFCMLATLFPSSKTLAAMYVLPQLANSQFMKNVPSKISTLAEKWVDNQIENMNAEATKKVEKDKP